MNYTTITEYRRQSKKHIGLYAKTRKISLVVLGVLILAVLSSLIFKTKSIVLQKKEYYGVYVGSYAADATANYYADIVKMRGGCGGVYKEEMQYFVFAAVYQNRTDAVTVATNLTEADQNASVFTFELPKTKIKFEEGNRGLLNDSANLFESQLDQLLNMAVEFDNHNSNGSDIIVSVNQMLAEIESATKVLSKIQKDKASNYLIDAFSRQKTVLKQISSNVIKSADIKIAYFDLLLINLQLREYFN